MRRHIDILAVGLLYGALVTVVGCGIVAPSSVSGGQAHDTQTATATPVYAPPAPRHRLVIAATQPTSRPTAAPSIISYTYTEEEFYEPLPAAVAQSVSHIRSATQPSAQGDGTINFKGGAITDEGGIGGFSATLTPPPIPARSYGWLWIGLFGLAAVGAGFLGMYRLAGVFAGVALLGLLPVAFLAWAVAIVVAAGLGYLIYTNWDRIRHVNALQEVVAGVESVKKAAGAIDIKTTLASKQGDTTEALVKAAKAKL
jgi:hypothetical protein